MRVARMKNDATLFLRKRSRIRRVSRSVNGKPLSASPTSLASNFRQGLDGKRRVVRRADLVDDDGVIAAILQNDAERVGAGKASSTTTTGHPFKPCSGCYTRAECRSANHCFANKAQAATA
jgi:hypothetical protein